MNLADLSPETLSRLKARRWDRIIEKHEGPEPWESTLRWAEPEFFDIGGRAVLLPIPREQHRNVTILRCIEAADGSALTVFLKDTTFVERAEDEWLCAGFLAVCERMPGESFYIASVYHEWFILDAWNQSSYGSAQER